MCSRWTAGGATMLQRLKLFTHLLGLYLRPHQGMALLERVQTSNLSDDDRDRITHIMRAALKLPAARGNKPSVLEASGSPRPTPQRAATRPRQSATASRRCQRPV